MGHESGLDISRASNRCVFRNRNKIAIDFSFAWWGWGGVGGGVVPVRLNAEGVIRLSIKNADLFFIHQIILIYQHEI